MLLILNNYAILNNMGLAVALGDKTVDFLTRHLPVGWHVAWRNETQRAGRIDGFLEVGSPGSEPALFGAEVRKGLEPRAVLAISMALRRAYEKGPWVVVSPFISSRSREILIAEGMSFVDFTGNIRMVSDSPALFIDRQGSDKNPKRALRPRASLRGPITARVVRYLCANRPPYGVRDIASHAFVDPGAVSRILEFAHRENLVERDERGRVLQVSWPDLIRYWSRDLAKDRVTQIALEPHGLAQALTRLRTTQLKYAVTGPQAATYFASAAPVVRADIYVEDCNKAIEVLGLHAPAQSGNIRLIQAYDDVVFRDTSARDELILCHPVQIAADLATLRGRSEKEYDALLDWMKQHESLWRK